MAKLTALYKIEKYNKSNNLSLHFQLQITNFYLKEKFKNTKTIINWI